MKFPDREEQKKIVRLWDDTGRELLRLRRQDLKDKPYDWVEVDALLELGENIAHEERLGGGLVEMQRLFMKADPH